MRNLGLLLLMSAIWGLTWIAIKIGVTSTPPLFFAATRFICAGILLGAIFRNELGDLPIGEKGWQMLTVALLLTTFCYGPLFWGMRHVQSGIAGVTNLALLPIALLIFGRAFGVESVGEREIGGAALGMVGLIGLFWPAMSNGMDSTFAGLLAIALGTCSAALGSVLWRLWMPEVSTGAASSVLTFAGGVGLLALSLAFEPVNLETLASLQQPTTLASWLFLVVFGSTVAFSIYLYLLRHWGPLRSGLYCFISPVVALVAGYLVFGERVSAGQTLSSAVLLVAAAIALGLTPKLMAAGFRRRLSIVRPLRKNRRLDAHD